MFQPQLTAVDSPVTRKFRHQVINWFIGLSLCVSKCRLQQQVSQLNQIMAEVLTHAHLYIYLVLLRRRIHVEQIPI